MLGFKSLWKETYKIPAPKAFTVGDSSILEGIVNGSLPKGMAVKTFSREKIAKTWKAALVLRKDSFGEDMDSLNATIYCCHKDYIDAYLQDFYYPNAIRKNGERDLNCECDRFKVIVAHHLPDEKGNTTAEIEFDLGCDGYLGYVKDCVKPFGFIVSFELPDSKELSERALRDRLAYLFRCPDIRKEQRNGK